MILFLIGLSIGWTKSVKIESEDQVAFELHYYISKGYSASNVKFYLENIDGMVFTKGQSKKVTGKITSSNLEATIGAVDLHFTENIKMLFKQVSWQKYPCQSISCEERKLKNVRTILTEEGLGIGKINGVVKGNKQYNSGNIIVVFHAVQNKNPRGKPSR